MKHLAALWVAMSIVTHAGALKFESLEKNLDAPADAKTVEATFDFENTSDRPVKITKSDPGCTCLHVQVAGGKLKYAPGESGTIKATFDVGNASGLVNKAVAVWLDNDPPDKPSLTLKVNVNIPVIVAIEPKTVKWAIGERPDPQTIEIRIAEGNQVNVLGVTSSSKDFKTELKAVENGRKYDLVITPTRVDSPGIGVFKIETDSPVAKHKIQQAFAVVRKPTAAETAAKP